MLWVCLAYKNYVALYSVGANSFAQHRKSNVISLFYKGVCNTPLRSSPQCYRSRVGMLIIICVDTYAVKDKKKAFQL